MTGARSGHVDKLQTSAVPSPAMSAWDPVQYARFERERAQAFYDLLDLVEPTAIDRAVDLGCGGGPLTVELAERFDIGETIGIDDSTTMLAAAAVLALPEGREVRFERGDIAVWTSDHDHDLVLANASLQWVPDHPAVLARWVGALRPGGQLAVQVPANALMPAHVVARELAESDEFRELFGDDGPPPDPVAANVLEPEAYAELLHDLGATEQHVRLQVYPHVLPSSRHVVEWVRGTTLTRFRAPLGADGHTRFVEAYERALLARIGDHAPYFFPFRRILFWARFANR